MSEGARAHKGCFCGGGEYDRWMKWIAMGRVIFFGKVSSLYIYLGCWSMLSSAAAGSELELCINADSPSSQYVNNQLWITRGN